MRWLVSILLVLVLVPGWTGSDRLPLIERDTELAVHGVPVAADTRRFGALDLVGLARLTSPAPAFGGFSAIAVRDGRITLLSDGGNWVSFGLRGGQPFAARAGALPDGPGTGWQKRDRDSESFALDPAGRIWVAFERANAIWRYAPDFKRATGRVRPSGMRDWRTNGGAETMVRFADGRFLVIAESEGGRRPRSGLLFDRDPIDPAAKAIRFRYRPPAGYDPSGAAVLPNGDVLVLNRRFRLPPRFSAKIVLLRAAAIRKDAVVEGREIATLAAPVAPENCEGIAVTRERGGTYLWVVTDNDTMAFRPTLLMKFRLRTDALR